jgi:hypothetical protein
MALKLRRGIEANRTSITPAEGELIYTTDNKQLFIGDASTAGGNLINGVAQGTSKSLAFYPTAGKSVNSATSLTWDTSTKVLSVADSFISITANTSSINPIEINTFTAETATVNSLLFKKASGTSGAPTAITSVPQDGTYIGGLNFKGYDGTNYVQAASINAAVRTTPTAGIVPGGLEFVTANASGVACPRLTIDETGELRVGPYQGIDAGSGNIDIRQTVSSSTVAGLSMRNTFNDASGNRIEMIKHRGTILNPLSVRASDRLGEFRIVGYDGNSRLTSSRISFIAEGDISTGKIPGTMAFETTNQAGVFTIHS